RVWSRGTETTWRIQYQKNKLKLGMHIVTGYVLSTVAASGQENDGSLGRQLIYTPRYTASGNITLGYRGTLLSFFHQYAGYRFTTSDNTQWLNPYYVASLRLSQKARFSDFDLTLFAACNNLFNANYVVLAGRPMPLRSYELGITLQTRSNNN